MHEAAFQQARRVRVGLVLAVLCAFYIGIVLVWSWLFRWSKVTALFTATFGIVHPTLLAAAVLAASVSAVALSTGLTVRDFGLRRRDVCVGAYVWLAAYAGLQLVLLLAAVFTGRGIRSGAWFAAPIGYASGTVIAQLFGTAVVEEAVFRGFVFRQVLVRVRGHSTRQSIIAAAIAAVPFALCHIPQRLSTGTAGADLAANLVELWVLGMVATYLYVRSRNLMAVMALHALFNAPAPLFASPLSVRAAYCVVLGVVIATLEIRAYRSSLKGVL